MGRDAIPNGAPGRPRPSWAALIALGLASRVVVVALGCALGRTGLPEQVRIEDRTLVASRHRDFHSRHEAALRQGPGRVIEPWYRWDAVWYAELSRVGYVFEPGKQCTVAFSPLLPVMMEAGARLGLDRYWVGLIVPNLAFPLGLACFGRAVLRATGDAATTWRAAILLVAYPRSFFFSAPYAESLAFALTAAALLAWEARRPGWAAACSFLAPTARISTVAIPVGVLAEWVADEVRRQRSRRLALLVVAAWAAGYAALAIDQMARFGDPTVQVRSQVAWDREPPSLGGLLWSIQSIGLVSARAPGVALIVAALLAWTLREPLEARLGPIVAGRRPLVVALGIATAGALAWAVYDCYASLPASPSVMFAAVLFLGLGLRAWRRRGPVWGGLVLVPVVQALATGSYISMTRFVLASFPAFVDAAELIRGRRAFVAIVAASLVAQGLAIGWFVRWEFLG